MEKKGVIADMSAIAGTASSLKTAGEIVQAMIGLRDASAFQTKAIELQRQILAAQQCALAAHSDQFSLLQRITELEKEVARAKSWDTEKAKYELKEIHPRLPMKRKPTLAASNRPIAYVQAAIKKDRRQFYSKQII